MSHTEGKLEVGDGSEHQSVTTIYANDALGNAIADCYRPHSLSMTHEEMKANARHLVACWNACEGIPTAKLELDGDVLIWIDKVALSNAALTKDCCELVDALRIAADYLPDLIGEWAWKEGEIAGNAKQYDDLVNASKAANAILAKYPEQS
ncbi:hypothetical protein SAMN05216420_101360 [Nitrosospira sp. Nl5]|uniref:hypothetical protein n=1 Tax=Nitrosospira sp. Nl5 TaxID=200120 RepID=UPI00088CAD0A|nr:hypothetical protein [Nitrosospira sp. Nl5]SCX92842.1 hypothetical protein SAMN05216420_101360 [Nitrosospira sp. Nl5]